MSETSASPPPETQLLKEPDLMSDIVLWRRKQLNVLILFAMTAAWTVMEVYQYNFITVISWVAMALLACLFFWGNIHRLLKKETPDLSELELREETAIEHAKLLKQLAEDGIRLMLHVSAEREWFVFAGVVACLFLIALVARQVDFLTICYIGVLGAMSVPVVYVKNEHKIREFGENLRMRSQRLYAMIGEKLQKMKSKIAGKHKKEIKEKKME